jgi:HEAT repeats
MARRLILVIVLTPVLAAPASAGILFGRKAEKPDPTQRVPELLGAVKTDGDESKRIDAAGELQHYDPVAFPDIVPVLIDVLQNDKKPGVRAEAAQTLSRLRPVSVQVGQALEQAVAKDPSMRVRLQARSALLSYRWNGYHGEEKHDDMPTARPKEPPPPQTKEPPLAPPPQTKEPPLAPPPAPAPAPAPRLAPTPAPLPPVLDAAPVVPSPAARPLPPGPAKPAAPPPADEKGPELIPPP